MNKKGVIAKTNYLIYCTLTLLIRLFFYTYVKRLPFSQIIDEWLFCPFLI